jgi:C_GCAxxG_C_C family probable redox protein
MNTQQRVRMADEYFSRYNCAQAVTASFKDVIGIDEKTALMLSSSFGAGFGKLREVCGAFSGMAIVAGLLYGDYGTDDAGKQAHYALIQKLADRFKQRHGSIICRDLLAAAEASDHPEIKPCGELVRDAVTLMCELIEEKENGK